MCLATCRRLIFYSIFSQKDCICRSKRFFPEKKSNLLLGTFSISCHCRSSSSTTFRFRLQKSGTAYPARNLAVWIFLGSNQRKKQFRYYLHRTQKNSRDEQKSGMFGHEVHFLSLYAVRIPFKNHLWHTTMIIKTCMSIFGDIFLNIDIKIRSNFQSFHTT